MISSFSYNTPTIIIFGKGVIKNLPDVLKKYGCNVLLTYGGGSIKKTGLYDAGGRMIVQPELFDNISISGWLSFKYL